jgi:glutaredoxin
MHNSHPFRPALLSLAALVALAGCLHASVTPQQVDAAGESCRQAIAAGRYDARRDTSVHVADAPKPAGTPVVLYGASWCEACHVAADYMRRHDIAFVERDVEADDGAADEFHALLTKAGFDKARVLPVMDVRGTIVLGFRLCPLEQAWSA